MATNDANFRNFVGMARSLLSDDAFFGCVDEAGARRVSGKYRVAKHTSGLLARLSKKYVDRYCDMERGYDSNGSYGRVLVYYDDVTTVFCDQCGDSYRGCAGCKDWTVEQIEMDTHFVSFDSASAAAFVSKVRALCAIDTTGLLEVSGELVVDTFNDVPYQCFCATTATGKK